MKLVKMSLAAAVLLGANAFAIDNVKVSGDAKLFYATDSKDYIDINNNSFQTKSGLFDKGASAADAALRLGVTGDLAKGISFGVTGYAISTLGLENNLVDKVWTGAHDVTTNNGAGYAKNVANGAQADDQAWIGEMWVAATVAKTTAKLGRMELDTPLAFSEKWSIVPNTFDAAVLINQDLPDTTLVGAWVGKGNGTNPLGNGYNELANKVLQPVDANGVNYGDDGYEYLSLQRGSLNTSTAALLGLAYDGGVVGAGANFNTFMNSGAYAVAIVNNSFKPLTAQAWYYNVGNVADAYWLQGDINCQMVKGLTIGAQYADMSPKGGLEADLKLLDDALGTKLNDDTSAYAFKLGYNGITNLKLAAAYSSVSDTGVLKIANVATNNLGGAQSKLYTEANWNYGYVGAVGSDSYMVSAEYDAGVAKLTAQYTDASVKASKAIQTALTGDKKAIDMNEIALTVSKSFGPLDTTLAYISTDADDQNIGKNGKSSRYDTIQAYLTLNF